MVVHQCISKVLNWNWMQLEMEIQGNDLLPLCNTLICLRESFLSIFMGHVLCCAVQRCTCSKEIGGLIKKKNGWTRVSLRRRLTFRDRGSHPNPGMICASACVALKEGGTALPRIH